MTHQPGQDEVIGSVEAPEQSGDEAAPSSLGALLDEGGKVDGLTARSADDHDSQARRLRFTANGWEYFRIWIVNVALTLLTLGIYSAWAKVRARRYLYGNVWLGDDSFDYTANPVAILRGRLLVATVLVMLWVAQILSLWYYYAAFLALMPLVPWVVVRARSFQLRRSEYRGIAFDFGGGYWDAAVWYPLSWVASFATLGLARPFTVFGRDRFLVTESSFGNRAFSYIGRPGPYYGMYVVTAIVVGGLYIGGVILLFASLTRQALASASDPEPAVPDLAPLMLGSIVIVAVILLFIAAFLRTRLLSYRWTSSRLGENEFTLDLSVFRMLLLYVTNAAAIMATLGLFIPFARIRVLRYVVGQFSVLQRDEADSFETGERQRVGAAGVEAAGEFGLEIGI